jgi:hypothetical protein
MLNIKSHFDQPSVLVIVITLMLFAFALFTGGLTHDLSVEAAIFLVSVKLILGSYRNSVVASETGSRLESIAAAVERLEGNLERQRVEHEQTEITGLGSVM